MNTRQSSVFVVAREMQSMTCYTNGHILKKAVTIENDRKKGINGKNMEENLRRRRIVNRPDLNELVKVMRTKN